MVITNNCACSDNLCLVSIELSETNYISNHLHVVNLIATFIQTAIEMLDLADAQISGRNCFIPSQYSSECTKYLITIFAFVLFLFYSIITTKILVNECVVFLSDIGDKREYFPLIVASGN